MAVNIASTTNHREREKGFLVYPVYSRRAGGLSIGINLFPDKKSCLFDCPYCEVFPFSSNAKFLLEQMGEDLRIAVSSAQSQNIPIKDICLSGSGEPTLSPAFTDVLKFAENIRAEAASDSELVVITNGTGLLQERIFSFLAEMAKNPMLNIWLKLDAGTPDWYQKMNRCEIPFEALAQKAKEFAACTPVTIQTMLCSINNEPPPADEAQAWESLVCELALTAKFPHGGIRKVQLYGKARSAPQDPLASQLPLEYLEKRAVSLRKTFSEKELKVPVEIYL
ncbi:MAG: hypothetical protein FWC97_03985 [Treponema sp.]|nr:hypothetical protein [Treponema sp.]